MGRLTAGPASPKPGTSVDGTLPGGYTKCWRSMLASRPRMGILPVFIGTSATSQVLPFQLKAGEPEREKARLLNTKWDLALNKADALQGPRESRGLANRSGSLVYSEKQKGS